MRVSYLGSYSPSAGHPAGTLENRVGVVTSIVDALPAGLGLFWLVPLWGVMAGTALLDAAPPRPARWHRDAAYGDLVPDRVRGRRVHPGCLLRAGHHRHMLGSNMATALASRCDSAMALLKGRMSATERTRIARAQPPTGARC